MTQKRKHYSKQFKIDAVKLVTEQGYEGIRSPFNPSHTYGMIPLARPVRPARERLRAGRWESPFVNIRPKFAPENPGCRLHLASDKGR